MRAGRPACMCGFACMCVCLCVLCVCVFACVYVCVCDGMFEVHVQICVYM